VRHLAAARFFESLATDELAGGLASHYLAAQRLAGDGAEADALAAQARISLRAAAERASALGSHEQALVFLEQALEVTTDPADRADLHARAAGAAQQGLESDVVLRHAEAVVLERRRVGDRPVIAVAEAALAQAVNNSLADPARAVQMLLRTWDEFSDLEQTPAGVAIMASLGRAYRGLDSSPDALAWIDRYLPISERLDLLDETTRGIMGRGSALLTGGRPREGVVLLRGAHQMAMTHDLEVEMGARVLLAFYEQWGEPAAGLALGREGMEIARRKGSRSYGFLMVGNAVIVAFRVGEWDWAASTLDEWLAIEARTSGWTELYVDRAILRSLRGEDASADIEAAAALRGPITDPQYESYERLARAWMAFAAGDLAGARAEAERAAAVTSYFAPLGLPLAARAALWAGDVADARRLVGQLRTTPFWGLALDADRAAMEAGVAALDGRSSEALAGYREALRAYRQLGLAFEEAAAAVDMATLLPSPERDAPDVVAAVAAARETLDRLRARPFLARLDSAVRGGAVPASGSAATPSAAAPLRTSAAAREPA
jgi:tetratricopeptide (TPR) repeat protein